MAGNCVAFVTHGGAAIGFGHVKRCVALARAFAGAGAQCLFLVSPDPDVGAVVWRAGFKVAEISWETDGGAARRRVKAFGADVIVVDSYIASAAFMESLRLVAGAVVAVDDLADRPLPVHVIVNGGLGAERLSYRGAPDTVFLLGPRYALVDPDYAELPERAVRDPIRRVLVSLGGGSHDAALRTALAAVDATLDCVAIDVAPGARGEVDLGFVPRRSANRVVVHAGLPELRGLMLDSDVAITGAGMTLYELAATGTPTVTVTMVSNQSGNAAAFSGAGAALSAGIVDGAGLGTALESHLGRLARDLALRAELGRRARSLIDGRGPARVAQETVRKVGSAR